jgi:acyl-homoserine-lactone acylase
MLRHGIRAALIFVLACSGSAPPAGNGDGTIVRPPAAAEYRATIRWTEHGVPHVLADDLGGLAFGQGYAFAAQHGCLLAERIVTLHSRRAATWGAGDGDSNVDNDFGYLHIGVMERAREAMAKLSEDSKAIAAGYAAGYNARLAAGGFTGFCKGEAWVVPITDVDVLAHGLDAALLASSRAFATGIGKAQPRGQGQAPTAALPWPELRGAAGASNGWAIGAERSASGHGMLVANPHFPWTGPLTFYESHLTVPGLVDAYGATLMGVPLLNIGFNASLGWTHTFSDAVRFAVYRLPLDPGDPHRYIYDGKPRAMTSQKFTIEVKGADGTLSKLERTLWRSHHGPMLDGGPLSWDVAAGQAFTLRDASIESTRGLDQYWAMMRAGTIAELREVIAKYQSTPFVNIMAADKAGDVFYADLSRVPNLSPQALAAWRFARGAMPPVQQAWEGGVLALDGSMPLFEWVDAPGAGAPGVIPLAAAPQLSRRDFVFNANDSAWIANPAQPLTAQSPLYGDIEVPLSPRSRMNLTLLTETGPNAASGADGKFDLAELEAAILSNRVFTAELLLDQVLAGCQPPPAPPPGRGKRDDHRLKLPSPPVAACAILAAWDRKVDLDSAGALLWREFVASYERKDYMSSSMFSTRHDPARPLETPAVLAEGALQQWQRLNAAAVRLRNAGIDPAARLRDHQFTEIGGKRFPVSGGPEIEGTTNQATYQPQNTHAPGFDPGKSIQPRSGLTERGYPINYGSSFVLVLELTDAGPRARGLMTYGSSSDPDSADARAQMPRWGEKRLRDLRFTQADIEADPALRVQEVSGKR